MEHLYTAYVKEINREPFYFVKHFLLLTEVDNITPLLIGYGMHRVYEKACGIAGIKDAETQKAIRLQHLSSLPAKVVDLKTYSFSKKKKSG